MEGLITLIIILVVSNLITKNRKKSGAAPNTAKKMGVQSAMERFEQWAESLDESKNPQVGQIQRSAAPAAQPAARAVEHKAELNTKHGDKLHYGEGGRHEASFEGISRPLAPSAELTAGRAAGSITFHSDEGRDVCDPSLMHGESGLEMSETPVFSSHVEDKPFLSAGDLVRGFVVSEILARPVASRMAKTR